MVFQPDKSAHSGNEADEAKNQLSPIIIKPTAMSIQHKRTVQFSCRVTQEDFDYLSQIAERTYPLKQAKLSSGDMMALVAISHRELEQKTIKLYPVPERK